MVHAIVSAGFHLMGSPAFRIYGRGRRENTWREISVFATHRRDLQSRWPAPLFRGTCITWTTSVIAVGWDFATQVIREQYRCPVSRDHPLQVSGGRVRDSQRRKEAGGQNYPSASEILAHEIGHTWQARRLSLLYWPIGAAFTLCREGDHWYNWFENQASEEGLFGGIVCGSVCSQLRRELPGGTNQ